MSDKFLICDEAIIPIKHVRIIRRDPNFGVSLCDRNTWVGISDKSFGQIKENLLLKDKHSKEMLELKKKIAELELHIALSPGGHEYLYAQKHYASVMEKDTIHDKYKEKYL